MRRTYKIPAKPKNDDGHLELIAKIIFIIGFNYKVVEDRWPLIKKAFHNFDISSVSKADVEELVNSEGMIRNRYKIMLIIHNAKVCEDLVNEHSSMQNWVKKVVKEHDEDVIFKPSLAEESQRLFKGIGKTTRDWVAYVFAEGKDEQETKTIDVS